MFETGEFLAIDWGTTNRRIYKFGKDGSVEQSIRDDKGILAMDGISFPAELQSLRMRFGDLPAICAGMVGSDRGWTTVPYVPTPCGIADLASKLAWVEPGRTAILPGVSVAGPDHVDVMRGEEVQLLGAIAGGFSQADALLCQPGTHCKWARMSSGEISDFRTSMTGELFALLVSQSLLAPLGNGSAKLNDDFRLGVRDSEDTDFLSRLFGIRADQVSGCNRIGMPHSYLSGLIIGTDARHAIKGNDKPVYVLAGADLGNLYLSAISIIGGSASLIDSHECFVAGIREVVRNI